MVQQQQKNRRRRRYVIDRPFQLSVVMSGIGAVMVATLIGVAALFLLPDARTLENSSGETLRVLITGTTVAHFVLMAGAVAVVSIMLTHRVAGPSAVLKHAVENMIEGKLDKRTTLRESDYLQDLAVAIGRLKDQMQQHAASRESSTTSLERALANNDTAAAQRLLVEARGALSRQAMHQ